MNVWLVTVGEPLPTDQNQRLYRTGILARMLAEAGHEVCWWTTAFDHNHKRHRYGTDTTLHSDGVRLELIHGPGYSRNVSIKRLYDHHRVAQRFTLRAEKAARPDIIVSSYPTVELCHAVQQYATRHGIPTIMDIRDLWPDIFVDILPGPLKSMMYLLLQPYFNQSRWTLTKCSSIVAVSEGYLQWGLQRGSKIQSHHDRVFPLAYEGGDIDPPVNDTEQVTFLFVGTFGTTYALEPVIRAARELEGNAPGRTRFIFCGDGEKRDAWQAEAKGSSNIEFTGWVDRDCLASLLREAHVGLAAYTQDAPQGIPNKVIEYMSAGLPIVSSLGGETEQLLREGGAGISYSEDKGLVLALHKMLDPDTRERIARGSHKIYTERFDARKVYAEYIHHIQTIAEQ